MRIISGTLRGRTLHPPATLPVRPTTDFAKEGLFNILETRYDFSGLHVLDLFAGTGNISFEFISRGVKYLTAVELNGKCCQYIKSQFKLFGIENAQVISADAFRFVKKSAAKYDIIFADPPFEMLNSVTLPDLILNSELLSENGIFIFEHATKLKDPVLEKAFEKRKYGNVSFSFFRKS